MLSQKDVYIEVPTTQPIFHHENVQLRHQPILVAVDVSTSMNFVEQGSAKSNLKLAEEMINKIGRDPELNADLKKQVDLCLFTFSDHVEVVKNWAPLSHFRGGIALHPVGVTAFHDCVRQSINAVRSICHSYAQQGCQVKRPQIFLITDGLSTDSKYNPDSVAEAQRLCAKYVDPGKIALKVILLPGGSTSDAKQLSKKISLYKVDDCQFGLPAIADFINASMVSFSSATIGEGVHIDLPPQIKTTEPVKRTPSGTRLVTEEVDCWN